LNWNNRVVFGEETVMGLLQTPRNLDWIGCIDFGTAMSKAAVVRRMPRTELTNVDMEPLAIGARDGLTPRNPLLLPSVIYVGDGSQGILFGEEAETAARRGQRRNRRAFVSPKEYLSVNDPQDLDEMLDQDVDPTGNYTARKLLALFLAHLLVQAARAAAIARVPWPVRLRIARPAWDETRARDGEQALRSLVLQAFALVDELGDQLAAVDGIAHDAACSALSKVMSDRRFRDPTAFEDIFELSSNGSAWVLEATAAAAGAIGDTGRRVVVVADIGGGTSDFGAFMTGLPGKAVLSEVDRSAGILRLAGDRLDELLQRHIFDRARIVDTRSTRNRGIVARVQANQRAYKELLFTTGRLTVELVDDYLTVTKEDFLADPGVQNFRSLLRSTFRKTLEYAVACARQNELDGRRTPVKVLLTGGGGSLPMVKEFVTDPPLPVSLDEALPEIPDGPLDQNFLEVRPQLAVAIGGAVQDLPRQTAPVRIQDMADAEAMADM
jgi:molecular chaperone DnaK (HSP70)